MKDPRVIVALSILFVVLCAIIGICYHAKDTDCSAKGGTLARSAFGGLVCVKAVE